MTLIIIKYLLWEMNEMFENGTILAINIGLASGGT
jgi:hypothetical protein